MAMVNSRSKAVFLFVSFAICRIRSSNPSQQHLMQDEENAQANNADNDQIQLA